MASPSGARGAELSTFRGSSPAPGLSPEAEQEVGPGAQHLTRRGLLLGEDPAELIPRQGGDWGVPFLLAQLCPGPAVYAARLGSVP